MMETQGGAHFLDLVINTKVTGTLSGWGISSAAFNLQNDSTAFLWRLPLDSHALGSPALQNEG
jgi:hypothetical protein